jgi:hypothetical protein
MNLFSFELKKYRQASRQREREPEGGTDREAGDTSAGCAGV